MDTLKPAVKQCPELEQVLSYSNQDVVDGLQNALDITASEAEMLFKEGLKWLWYCNQPDSRGYSSIDTSLLILDEVWHTFILYTKDYSQFCLEYFGRYIHHAPTTRQDLANNAKKTKQERIVHKKKQLELVFDIMGKETTTVP